MPASGVARGAVGRRQLRGCGPDKGTRLVGALPAALPVARPQAWTPHCEGVCTGPGPQRQPTWGEGEGAPVSTSWAWGFPESLRQLLFHRGASPKLVDQLNQRESWWSETPAAAATGHQLPLLLRPLATPTPRPPPIIGLGGGGGPWPSRKFLRVLGQPLRGGEGRRKEPP